ncbi:hypothetical protein [Xanthocytophaga flava]|uniref:hypothetical protein n=1 Tax=Xanthocytophaga flava TaxID=3048013 RepID=UPI0028D5F600|nr:hypothetical protein [Xanthocytophaga flavus]MDJ1470356.1 hypothetical protein [Xanthocytophaga flavus]
MGNVYLIIKANLFLILALSVTDVFGQSQKNELEISELKLHEYKHDDSIYVIRQNKSTSKKTKPGWFNKISLGGNFAAQLSNPLLIDISPTVGYKFTDRVIAGTGLTYIYSKSKSTGIKQQNSIYGGRIFAQYGLRKWIALRVEGEALDIKDLADQENNRKWILNPLGGAGIILPVGKQSGWSIFALYNFTYYTHPLNQQLYRSPWIIRTGISF